MDRRLAHSVQERAQEVQVLTFEVPEGDMSEHIEKIVREDGKFANAGAATQEVEDRVRDFLQDSLPEARRGNAQYAGGTRIADAESHDSVEESSSISGDSS